MKLFITTDLEGVAGIINGKDYLYPTSRYHEAARRLLAQEVNAAVEGFAAGGFKEFLIADGHGAGAIDIEQIDARAKVVRGWGKKPYPFGLSNEFDAMAFVGQHAKAGSRFSHLTHTEWWNVRDSRINGQSIGEYGAGALCAGDLGVPVVFAAGEQALDSEVHQLTPWVHAAAVLQGVIEDPGDELSGEEYETFHEAAIHMQPRAACELIRGTAQKAARDFAGHRSSFKPLRLEAPYRLETFLRPYRGEPATQTLLEHPSSIISLLNGTCT